MPNYLVTNDDGIDSPALADLVDALRRLPDTRVYVVAPSEQWSAGGHSITIREPLYVEERPSEHFEVPAWRVEGSPADCVKLALNHLLDEPIDLVVSGINLGYNVATDVLYSGTVAAAIEGVLAGTPALAVSSGKEDGNRGDYRVPAIVAAAMTDMIRRISTNPWLLNVNVPDVSPEELAGVSFTELGPCPYDDKVLVTEDASGRLCYRLGVDVNAEAATEGTDLFAVRANRISITPLEVLRVTQMELLGDLSRMSAELENSLARDLSV